MVQNLSQSQSTDQQTQMTGQVHEERHAFESIQIEQATLAVLGAGAWGSALATIARNNGHEVRVWSRRSSVSLEDTLDGVDMVVSAIPMKGVAETAAKMKEIGLPPHVILVTATKGLDPETTRTPSAILESMFPQHAIVVLSGPNLSKEIEGGLPAATVVASKYIKAAEAVQVMFSSDTFRAYTNNDPIGTELGGTLKNVVAIAAGVCDGLQLGTNAKSAMVTRALAEMMRVGTEMGANPETFWGLAGLGDLLATCNSSLSRNYRVGYGLGQGQSLDRILEDLHSTAEGVNTTHVLMRLARDRHIDVPIACQVERLLEGKISPMRAIEALMERELKSEFEDLDI
jgi:glycerol-3-phosphate dehydrogenase (NAD(P)+)